MANSNTKWGVMILFSHETEILRKLRLIEALKAELVLNIGKLFQAVADNSEKAITSALAAVVVSCYCLGKRLGIDFSVLDDSIGEQLNTSSKNTKETEKWFGDYSELRRYFRDKR
ncbi:MAG: MazG-like domain containing protein [Firmicutes bacterium]|nr:MazG-like domain containing protein [Bacillota bacterium]